MNAGNVERVRAFFESISRESVAHIGEIYADDAYFKDPFNEVHGTEAIGRIFAHMFDQVQAPRFVIRETVAQGGHAFMTWEFLFRLHRRGGSELVVRGATHLKFAADGRIGYHRDYWDVAEELYEKLPLVGALMRLLKKRAAR